MYTSDQEIIVAIRLGRNNDSALKWVYHECTPMIRQLGSNFNFASEDCKDILQDAVIVFWEKVRKNDFILTSKISTFIYQVCKNMFLNKTKQSKRASIIDISNIEDALVEDIVDEELHTTTTVKLALFLNELGERCRNIIIDFYSGTTMKVIASKYQYSNPETATAQKYRCLSQLRKKFENSLI